MAPIHVKDVATVFVRSLQLPEAVHQTYPLCGPEPLEWKTIIRILGLVCGKYKLAVPTPALAVKTWARLLDGFDFFPITRDQISMLLEGNTCDASETFRAFGITPIRFNDAALSYLKNSGSVRRSGVSAA